MLIPSRELADSTQLQWLFMLGARKAIEAKNAESLRQIIEVFAYRSSSQQARLTSLYTAIVEIAQACDSSEIATHYRGKIAELQEGR